MDLLIRYIIQITLFCCFLSQNGAEGMRKLSKDKDLDLEKQLSLINKSSIKSFQTKYGYIYDCIDFYKQPAFDHPLLKNHTFDHQMKPPSIPKMAQTKEDIKNIKNGREIELTIISCPVGTIPIRRVTKEDLVRFKLHSEQYKSNYSVLTADNPGTHYAVARTRKDQLVKYNGGYTSTSVYNPYVQNSQYSSIRMKISNGRNSIQVGWTVNPSLYGDHKTRIYTYLNSGVSQCFNTQCPGFIIVNTQIPIESPLEPISERGGAQYDFKFLIYRDIIKGDWWLALGEELTRVGFWPKQIFTDLSDLATSVEWGGEVFSPPEIPSPPMGNGHLIDGGSKNNAFCAKISTVNEANKIVDATNTIEDADVPSIYEVRDVPKGDEYFRHTVMFGGPGGITGN